MPHCKHKMYCVFFCFVFVFLFLKGGGSQLFANQTGDGWFCPSELMFVQYREEMKGSNETTSLKVQHCSKKTSKYPFRLSH